MKRLFVTAACLAVIDPGFAFAQASPPKSEPAQQGSSANQVPMSAPSTTLPPAAPGSTEMREVPTPAIPAKQSTTGGSIDGGS